MSECIVMTGGGTAGHVTPNLALIEHLSSDSHFRFIYIGSYQGIEKDITQGKVDRYYAISTGKLRRSKSFKNFIMPFQVAWGTLQSLFILKRVRPSVIFSKGGFVSVPVILAGKCLNIPVIVHESDRTPGLANRIAFRFADQILTTFPETNIPKAYRAKHTGTPIRPSLMKVPKPTNNQTKPTLLVVGGSQGSTAINQLIWDHLSVLTELAKVIHICGNNRLPSHSVEVRDYTAIDYANESMGQLIAQADIIVSRAGANSLCEWLHLHKPHLLIPLPASHSRGDQIENADYFEAKGISLVYREESQAPVQFLEKVKQLIQSRDTLQKKLINFAWPDGTKMISDILCDQIKHKITEAPRGK